MALSKSSEIIHYEPTIPKWSSINDKVVFLNYTYEDIIEENFEYIYLHCKNVELLKILYLEKKKKLKYIPKSIERFKQLESLYLIDNNLKRLSKCIKYIPNLKTLNLSNNKFEEIPDSIGDLINLIELNFSHNNLSKISNNIGNLINLKFLNLSHNKLQIFPINMSNLIKLEILDVSHNNIIEFPECFCNITNLCYLDLSNNYRLKNISENIVNLINLDILKINCLSISLYENMPMLKINPYYYYNKKYKEQQAKKAKNGIYMILTFISIIFLYK